MIILGLFLGIPRVEEENAELYLYAAVVVLGTLVMLLLPVPWLRRLDGSLTMVVDWRDPAVRRVLKLMLPVTLTIGLINVSFFVDMLFASRLLDPELAPTAIDKAFRLYMLPQGLFGVAVVTVLFPTLARLSARGEEAGLRRALDGGPSADRLPARPGLPRLDRARRPDREARLRAGGVHGERHHGRRGLPAGVLDRAGLQRLDAAAQPQLLRDPVELDPDLDRARHGRSQRGARRGLLSPRHLGNPARDGNGEHPRRRDAPRGDAASGRPRARRPNAGGRRAASSSRARSAAASAFGVWYGLDEWLGRSTLAQIVSLGAALVVAGLVYAGVARALGIRELETLLLLRARRLDPTEQR